MELKPGNRDRQCSGKLRHASEQAAQEVADAVNARPDNARRARRHPHTPYLCPHCKGWHVGHSKWKWPTR